MLVKLNGAKKNGKKFLKIIFDFVGDWRIRVANELSTLGATMLEFTNLYTELACDADLMRQLPETHPVKEAMRSFERNYLGRTEG